MSDRSDDGLPPLSADTLDLYLPLYLDGELAAEDIETVEHLLDHSAEARALLDDLRQLDPLLGQAYADTLDQPVSLALARSAVSAGTALSTARVTAPPAAPSVWKPMLVAACAAGIVFGVGGYGYGTVSGTTSAQQEAALQFGWIAQIAAYHRLFAQEDQHLVELAAADRSHIRDWLGDRTGLAFDIPDLGAQGFSFAGARLLAVNGQPTAQLMFTSDTGGRPIGLCFLKGEGADAGFSQEARDDMNVVTWRKDGFNFILVGWEEDADFQEVAQSAADGIEI